MKVCPSCGSANPDDARFCGECATDLTSVASTPETGGTQNLGLAPGGAADAPPTTSLGGPPVAGAGPVPPAYPGMPPATPGAGPPPASPYGQPPAPPYGQPPLYTGSGTPAAYPGAVQAAPQMGTAQWVMVAFGVLLALSSLIFFPICFGPIAIALGAGVYATGGVQGKKYGLWLMIGAGVCLVLGMACGAFVNMAVMNSSFNTP